MNITGMFKDMADTPEYQDRPNMQSNTGAQSGYCPVLSGTPDPQQTLLFSPVLELGRRLKELDVLVRHIQVSPDIVKSSHTWSVNINQQLSSTNTIPSHSPVAAKEVIDFPLLVRHHKPRSSKGTLLGQLLGHLDQSLLVLIRRRALEDPS